MHPETFRKWVHRAEIDTGEREGYTRQEREEIRQLRARLRRLEEEKVTLQKAAIYIAPGAGLGLVRPKSACQRRAVGAAHASRVKTDSRFGSGLNRRLAPASRLGECETKPSFGYTSRRYLGFRRTVPWPRSPQPHT